MAKMAKNGKNGIKWQKWQKNKKGENLKYIINPPTVWWMNDKML